MSNAHLNGRQEPIRQSKNIIYGCVTYFLLRKGTRITTKVVFSLYHSQRLGCVSIRNKQQTKTEGQMEVLIMRDVPSSLGIILECTWKRMDREIPYQV